MDSELSYSRVHQMPLVPPWAGWPQAGSTAAKPSPSMALARLSLSGILEGFVAARVGSKRASHLLDN